MPAKEKQRKKLIRLLKELFQIDQPDLDFGFYRIMHAKSKQVMAFLENDLLKIIEDAFGVTSEIKQAELKKKYEEALETARSYGAPEPEKAAPVKEARAAWDAALETESNEGEIYDHLYRFFERYYDNGDFMSRRYLVRESSGKAAPYAIPYDGSEVKLHWANADQYYIKTSEYFNNYTFKLRPDSKTNPLRVHFCIADATEGEHGNIKATDGQKRYFIIHKANPVSLANNELVIRFEYRPDPKKTGQDAKWQEKRRNEAVKTIFKSLENLEGAEDYLKELQAHAPTDKQKDRTLLAKYLAKYTARNTMDYFIHKDLGGFLQRELDFYIKNEVMRLDDIENADAPKVEQYLEKIKVLRKIAGKLIEFLAQLEDFQKKLWLKKKFVVETNYCITLDRVPEELYPEIAANDAQREEWVRLFAIDEIKKDLHQPGYSEPLTVEFLKANSYLALDTKYFSLEFKQKLLEIIENSDWQYDGLLVHSENFQALNLLKYRYRQQIVATYLDPPFNTVHSEIIYKNQYKHSSWLSLIANVVQITPQFWHKTFSLGFAIDDYEFVNLAAFLDELFPTFERSVVVVNHHPQGAGGRLSRTHEYFILCSPPDAPAYQGKYKDDYQENRSFMRSGTAENNYRFGRWKSFYALIIDPITNAILDAESPVPLNEDYPTENTPEGYKRIYPINSRGEERVWRSSYITGKQKAQEGKLIVSGQGTVYEIIDHDGKRETLFSNWIDSKFNAGVHGSNVLGNMGIGGLFDYPKSIFTVETALWAQTYGESNAVVLDYFAGSGTTGHAVINLNREDGGNRKYILVEMGDYFDTVLKPRIKKVVYSESWKNGKPISRNTGISHMFKYIRLESYEDCLNNLELKEDSKRQRLLIESPQLQEDYMLHYMLEVETRGSQSLLNIDAFADPTAYKLKVKKPGSNEYEWKNVDLLETFNYLIGLRVEHIAAPKTFTAKFKREPDPELPEDANTRLILDGRLKQNTEGHWWFRKVEGWVPDGNGGKEKVLIVWRKLTGDMEKDNLMLDEWFKANRISTRDFEFDTIYVNGSNNLPNLKQEGDNWKVRLIEEDFHRLMWDTQDV